MHPVVKMFNRMATKPFGKKLFSMYVCRKAPYFGSISPVFTALAEGYAEVTVRNRRKVRNHLGTIHAIAMCNMAELAAGMMTEVSIPQNMRWIPKGMDVEYLKKAESNKVRAQAHFIDTVVKDAKQDVKVEVKVLDDNDATVCRAVITMLVSPKPTGSESPKHSTSQKPQI